MHRGPSENKKLNCLRWKISYLCNLSLGFACYIFNLIVTRLLTRNNKQENKRISPDWWNHDNLLNLYTVLMFLHVASLRLFQLNFLFLSCLNEVPVPLPVMMCCSPQNPLETSASLPEKIEVISSVCCTSQPWTHLRFAYTSAVNTSSWRRSWLLSVSLAQRLSDAWNGRRRRTKTSRRVSGCTFSHRTMSPAIFAAFVQQHCDTDFLTITIFFNPQNPKSSKLCVCTTFSSICGSLPSLSLPLFLHFDILCFSDTLPISLSLCVLSRHQHVFLIILCVQEAN